MRPAAIALLVMSAFAFYLVRRGEVNVREVTVIVVVSVVGAVIPVLFFYAILAALRDRHGNRICKRLKPGRQLSGVCVGLAEATGVNVVIGLRLYIALDLAMPVHPDDRQYLLRFKLRRAWQRRFADGDHHAR